LEIEYSNYRALWSAVLLTALNDCKLRNVPYKKKSDNPKELREWAKAWIRYPGDEPRSFSWICQMLEVNDEALRKHALEPNVNTCDNLTNIRPVRCANVKRKL
jgi:hypothetical protein